MRATAHPAPEGGWRVYYRDGTGREHLAFATESRDPELLVTELEAWARERPGMLYHDAGITVANADSLDLVARLHRGRDPGRDVFHVMRRSGIARALARAERADPAVVECGCYLLGLSPDDAETLVMALGVQGVAEDVLDRARRAVREVGATLGFGDAAAAALPGDRLARHTRPAAAPDHLGLSSVEAQVIHDAEVLERLGALGVVRAFVRAAWEGRDLPAAEAALRRGLSVAHAVTRTGRRLERARRQAAEAVLEAIARERTGRDLPRG